MEGKEGIEVDLLGHCASHWDFGRLKGHGLVWGDGIAPLVGNDDIEPGLPAVSMEKDLPSRSVGQLDGERNGFVGNELSTANLEVDVNLGEGLSVASQQEQDDAKKAMEGSVQNPYERKNEASRKRKSCSPRLLFHAIGDPEAKVLAPDGRIVHPFSGQSPFVLLLK